MPREKGREKKKKEDTSTSIYNSVETRVGCRHVMTTRRNEKKKKEEDRGQREADAEDCIGTV